MADASRVPHALWRQLETTLPTARQTLFLRACLHEGPLARDAFRPWMTAPDAALAPYLPLLWWSARGNGLETEPHATTVLRAAHVTEGMRWEAYRRICRSAFDCLHEAGVPFVALKGAALAETIYPSPLVRHTGDIDVLVEAHDLDRAASAMLGRGWRWSARPAPWSRDRRHLAPLIERSGVPIELHERLLIPYYALPYDQFRARSRDAHLMGTLARILCPADALLHVVAHGVTDAMNGTPVLRWVPDAWFLMQASGDLDWSIFTAGVEAARLGLPTFVALRYLTAEMAAPVPRAVLDDIERLARASTLRDCAAARLSARPWRGGTVGEIWSGPGPALERLGAIWRRAFPSPIEATVRFGLRPWEVPGFYVSRLARYARSGAAPSAIEAPARSARRSAMAPGVADASEPRSIQ
jgi:hypothetical protein